MNIPVVDTVAVKAAAFDAIGGKRRDSLQRRLYLSLIRAHAEGVVSLTTKELREWHASKSGEWKEGPIPARTGQPCLLFLPYSLTRAYPRSHGATSAIEFTAVILSGLSPLARGNPAAGAVQPQANGPIPARTGQP